MKNILYSIFLVYVLGMPLLAQVPRVVDVPPTLSRMEVQLLRQARQAGKAAPLWAEQMNLALETNALAEQKRLTELVERVPFFAQSPAELTRLSKTGRVQLTPSELRPVFTPEDLAQTPAVAGVFQVRNLVPADGQLTYSGTVIRDQNEVYGVVAAHILRGADNNTRHLTRTFVTDIWTPKGYRSAVVKPVFVASGIDLALIKFSPQVETLLEAVELETQFPQVGQTLISQGFINDKEVVTLARTVTEVAPFSIRTTMPWPREKRTGLCGSSVKNMDGKIIGIHIGSSRKMANEQEDIGYIVPAWQLRKMIEAYHNEDVTVPFVVDGETVFEMHADEYISQIVLLDEYGQSLERLNPSLGLPSQQLMRKLLHTPLLQRMEITFGRRFYETPYSSVLTDTPNVRSVTYTLPQAPGN